MESEHSVRTRTRRRNRESHIPTVAVVVALVAAAILARAGINVARDLVAQGRGAWAVGPTDAGSCALSGTVTLSGRDGHGAVTLAIQGEPRALTDEAGAFAIPDAAKGPGAVTASHPGYLSAEALVNCTGTDLVLSPVALRGGDVDNDGDVDLFDLTLVAANYGRCTSDPDLDPRADITASGCVDIFDLVLLGASYQMVGPSPWHADESAVSFAGDLLPIIEAKCVLCHGAAGGLALGTYTEVMAGSTRGPVVVPGQPEASPLYTVLTGESPPPMPPGNPLPADQIELFRRWIAEGAPDN